MRFYIPMSTLQAWVISRSEIFSNFYLFIIDLFIYLFIYLFIRGEGLELIFGGLDSMLYMYIIEYFGGGGGSYIEKICIKKC